MNSLGPFLIGLIGQSLEPFKLAGTATKDAFKAVGGDLARMVRPKRMSRMLRPRRTRRGRSNFGRNLGRMVRRPLSAFAASPIGQAASETKKAFSTVGGDLAHITGLDKYLQLARGNFGPMRRKALRSFSKGLKRWWSGPQNRRKAGSGRRPRPTAPADAKLKPLAGWADFIKAQGKAEHPAATALHPIKSPGAEACCGKDQRAAMIRLLARIAVDIDAIKTNAGGAGGILPGGAKAEDEVKKSLLKTLAKGTVAVILSAAGAMIATKKYVEEVVEHNRDMARVNGPIAGSFQQLDVADFLRRIRMAQGAQQTTIALNDQVREFRDAIAPLEIAIKNIENLLGILLIKTLGPMLGDLTKKAQELVDELRKKAGLDAKKGDPPPDLIKRLIDGLAKGQPNQRAKPMQPMK